MPVIIGYIVPDNRYPVDDTVRVRSTGINDCNNAIVTSAAFFGEGIQRRDSVIVLVDALKVSALCCAVLYIRIFIFHTVCNVSRNVYNLHVCLDKIAQTVVITVCVSCLFFRSKGQ